MPTIRGLRKFLQSRGLINEDPISVLKDTSLGIDAVEYFKRSQIGGEALQTALGGGPLALRKTVTAEVDLLRESGIAPVFIFGGLWPAPVHHNGQWNDRFGRQRDVAWRAASRGNHRTAAHEFTKIGNQLSLHTQRDVMRELARLGISTLRAPYTAAAQLALLSGAAEGATGAKDCVRFTHAAWGGLELLLYGVERVVIETDLGNGVVSWVDLHEVLHDLRMSFAQFRDMCLLAGYGACRTCPMVMDENGRFRFQRAYELIQQHGSALAVGEAHPNNPELQAMDFAQMVKGAQEDVRHHLVLHPGCCCAPLQPYPDGEQPSRTFGLGALPRELHLILSKGTISPQTINNIINGRLSDSPASTDCEEFTALLDGLKPMRAETFEVLAAALQENTDIRDRFAVVNTRWYNQDFATVLCGSSVERQLPGAQWALSPDQLLSSSSSSKNKKVVGRGSLYPLRRPAAAVASGEAVPECESAEGLVGNVLYRTLHLAGFLNTAGERTKGTLLGHSDADDEAAVLASGLLRLGALHSKQLSLVNSQGKTFSAERSGATWGHSVRIVARTCSLLQLTCKEEAWAGPLDRDLSAFCGLAKALQHALHNLAEAVLVDELLGRGRRVVKEGGAKAMHTLGQGLPLQHAPSSAMGVVMSAWLRGAGLQDLPAQFPQAAALEQDLRRAVRFFRAIAKGVQEEPSVDAAVRLQFANALAYLDKRIAADPMACEWDDDDDDDKEESCKPEC